MKIGQCFLELQLKMSLIFFETHCRSLLARYLINRSLKFHQIYSFSVVGDKDELTYSAMH